MPPLSRDPSASASRQNFSYAGGPMVLYRKPVLFPEQHRLFVIRHSSQMNLFCQYISRAVSIRQRRQRRPLSSRGLPFAAKRRTDVRRKIPYDSPSNRLETDTPPTAPAAPCPP